MRVVAIDDDGVERDVTEGVQVMYDAIYSSMDWGSGFLDAEEVFAILAVARACGFAEPEELVRAAASYFRMFSGKCAVCGRRMGQVPAFTPCDKGWEAVLDCGHRIVIVDGQGEPFSTYWPDLDTTATPEKDAK